MQSNLFKIYQALVNFACLLSARGYTVYIYIVYICELCTLLLTIDMQILLKLDKF